MPTSGYPTPDVQSGDVTYGCIPVFVPNNPEFQGIFAAAIYGLYAQMSKEYFWREFGTMSPEQAALLSSYALAQTEAYAECGGTMSCEDIADCVESELVTNETLVNVITNTINQNGFGNPNRVNSTETKIADRNVSGFNDKEIYTQASCDLDALWSGIRYGIVARMDDIVRDVLEDLTSIADIPERIAVFLDIVPVLGDIAEGLLFNLSESAPDLLNLYNAYSSEATLDELACDIFSLVCSECRYPTHEELYNYYQSFGMPASPTIQEFVLEVMSELVAGAIGVIAKTAYFTLQTWHLGILYLQAKFAGSNGSNALFDMAKLGEDFSSDNWLQLCDTCNEPYRIKIWDFTETDKDSYRTSSYPTTSGHGIYIPGVGWIPQQLGAEGNGFISVGVRQDPSWRIRAIGLKFANQAAGNGNMTFNILRTIPASNAGGTAVGLDWGTTGWTYYENGLGAITAIKEYGISYSTQLNLNRAWTHFGVIYDAEYAPPDAMPISSPNFSGTVFP